MKFYITKYALTEGILELEGEMTKTSERTIRILNGYANELYHTPFWYTTKEDAIKHANKLKANKINSLKKQLTKLENLTF